MTLLQQPNEVATSLLVSGLLYGQPGVGKTTCALSSPAPVLIDLDRGMKRVERRFQVPSLQVETYRQILDLLQSTEIDPFETLVFDTLGKLIDRVSEYVIEQNPKNAQGDGSLSMKGWGAIKREFQNLLSIIQGKNKHVIFVAHEKEEKDGDQKVLRPDVSGSSGKDLLKELDFMGYLEMRGNDRTVSFTPSERFYAKNSLQLPPVIKLPNLDGSDSNTFIAQTIIQKSQERAQEESRINVEYQALLTNMRANVEGVTTVEQANTLLDQLNNTESIWNSVEVLKRDLWDKAQKIGLTYDKDAKTFKGATKLATIQTADQGTTAAALQPDPEKPTPAPEQPKDTAQEKPLPTKDDIFPGDVPQGMTLDEYHAQLVSEGKAA